MGQPRSTRKYGRIGFCTLFGLLILGSSGLGCVTTRAAGLEEGQPKADILFTNTDNVAATKQLVTLLKENNFKILNEDSKWFTLKYRGMAYWVSPKLSPPGKVDRVIVRRYHVVKKAAKEDPRDVIRMVWRLNERLNVGQFSLDKDRDLMILCHITFIDTLGVRDIEYFLNYMHEFQADMEKAAPELRNILE
tara:strand:+ start:446 stop:1021 length:576 start_codon:yes stop_codon:yes gene_type:complete